MKKTKTPRTTLAPGLAKVLKRLHYPLEVILLCVRWYVAYSLSLRNLAEMMDERGWLTQDHQMSVFNPNHGVCGTLRIRRARLPRACR